MKLSVGRAAIAAALGLLVLSAAAPAPSIAQSKMPGAQKVVMAPKHKVVKKRAPSKTVMKLQAALNKNGAALKVDGHWGRQTRDALKKYQAANGMKASGKLDKATRKKLAI